MRLMRKVAMGAAAIMCGGLLSPDAAMAAPSETVTEFNAGLDCTGTTSAGDTVRVSTSTSAQFGDQLVATVGPQEAPEATAYSSQGGWRGDSIEFELDVFAGGGGGHREAAGSGHFSATTTVTSTSEHTSRSGSGNQRVKTTIISSVLDADATLTLPGFRIGALDCSGSSTLATYVSNTPASTVRFERRFYDRARCSGNAVVGLFGPVDGEYYLSVEVGRANNQYNLFGVVAEPKGSEFTTSLPLRNSQTGEVLGVFDVAVTLQPLERPSKSLLRTAIARTTVQSTLYEVSAQVSLPWMDVDAACQALEVVSRSVVRASQGPKPSDQPPTHDGVAGSRYLSVPDTVRTTTRGASVALEAPIDCATAPGRSVWYSFVGTGKDVRFDTAGSSFDTAVAVYHRRGGALQQVACNDDVERPYPYPTSTLQARLTMPTVAGRTYYVQVAGVFADFGRLVLAID